MTLKRKKKKKKTGWYIRQHSKMTKEGDVKSSQKCLQGHKSQLTDTFQGQLVKQKKRKANVSISECLLQ